MERGSVLNSNQLEVLLQIRALLCHIVIMVEFSHANFVVKTSQINDT